MAKYTMHDYEKEMREEERQTQLQKALEEKLESESFGAEDNWQEWQKQQQQEQEQRFEEFDDFEPPYYPEYDDYFDYDWFDGSWLEDDFGDSTCDDDPFGEEDCYPDSDYEEEDELYLEMCETAVDPEMLRISRKAISRNRHLNAAKAKKRAEESARILERRYWNLDANATPFEEYRAYARATSATKKAERVKTA